MYAQVATTLLALAGAASATQQFEPLPALAQRDALAPRQAAAGGLPTSLGPACTSALDEVLPVYNGLPTPAADLMTLTAAMTDPCATPTLTGKAEADYSSYSSEVMAWYTSNSAVLYSALSQCPALEAYASAIPVCSTAAGGAAAGNAVASTTAASAAASGSSGASSSTANATSSGSASSSPVQAAAARETGLVKAAGVAAVAFVGAVIAL
ncbi:hypothetical protein GGR56DRAFT_46016 [Xylariaceae sp. FL0804]|nr:hypothetical protein GGR56DRAFT_46016 [Xylariaceae sp. FL0804]